MFAVVAEIAMSSVGSITGLVVLSESSILRVRLAAAVVEASVRHQWPARWLARRALLRHDSNVFSCIVLFIVLLVLLVLLVVLVVVLVVFLFVRMLLLLLLLLLLLFCLVVVVVVVVVVVGGGGGGGCWWWCWWC